MSSAELPTAQSTEVENSLFNGDRGDLPLDTRRVLVQLLTGPYLDGRRHALLWPVLIRDEPVICRRLSELFLSLVIDRDQQVAFTRQADTGELEVPVLLRRAPLTFIDSVVLLYLRQQLMRAEARNERAVVSLPEIAEYMALYGHSVSTDHAGFVKRVNASIEKIKQHSILQRIRETEDRLEISPTLKLLFSAEEVQALTAIYVRMREGAAARNDVTPSNSTDEPPEDE
jgi:hypothetical protein